MGRRCCIDGCSSTSRLAEHHGVTYHSFPLDAAIRSIWIRNTNLNLARNITKSVLVCSRHFRRADFQPQRSGKYLLRQRVFPTVFPWGKIDPAQVESDLEELQSGTLSASLLSSSSANAEETTKATVEATIAQIMAETAELNAAAGVKKEAPAVANTSLDGAASGSAGGGGGAAGSESGAENALPSFSTANIKFEPVSAFNPGVRLEAQDFCGVWHTARVVEVDNDDREVLIKFERTGKTKSAVQGTEEWIPMNSTRLRQKTSAKPILSFELEEKCMARWSGPRKFPGTIKKILENDTYEVLFDDGYVKNVRAVHMNKMLPPGAASNNNNKMEVASAVPATAAVAPSTPVAAVAAVTPLASPSASAALATPPPAKQPRHDSPVGGRSTSSAAKKRAQAGQRKDWPLLDMSKLDLTTLNLPEIPRDGEWTCHWVNDQPIGREGYLIVGEHRKPTVIVDDWRLPPGWVKHMYQRSNVLGKWDVILVTPSQKRFRSKADLKIFLEEQGQHYNPDIYDFSIHRRRAKDINAYVYTPDYTPQPAHKPKTLDTLSTTPGLDLPLPALPVSTSTAALASTLAAAGTSSQYIETPVATAMPPMELMTPAAATAAAAGKTDLAEELEVATTMAALAGDAGPPVGDGFAFIGGLKVQIVDNLFRCPQEGCAKNFRKENHLQIHVKHYHQDLIKLLGDCPKMQELAEKRTHPTAAPDQNESQPKNQIPNHQFFAKLHQQDLEQTRAHRKSIGAASGVASATAATESLAETKTDTDIKITNADLDAKATAAPQTDTAAVDAAAAGMLESTANSSILEQSLNSGFSSFVSESLNSTGILATSGATPNTNTTNTDASFDTGLLPNKRSRFSPSKRTPGSRKSCRQRTTRRYLTAAQATAGAPLPLPPPPPTIVTADSSNSFGGVADFEETRHSFNATPVEAKMMGIDAKKRKSTATPATPLSSIDSPVTADSGSSSFQPLQAPSSNELDAAAVSTPAPQYIKENGELIKIVRMRQEEIINCLCTYGEEDGLMIQCELCLCWQHGICNGIDKESDVPDKYVCYICRNPQRARESLRFKHDQDWLYEGKLPVANYHLQNPDLPKRFEVLKKSHTLTGNLIELKRFMHSLRVKINIANNRCHPKLYLWAKKWDEDLVKLEEKIKKEEQQEEQQIVDDAGNLIAATSSASTKKIKTEPDRPVPNIPQPEAPIDPAECQQRLLEHIKVQQGLVMNRLEDIEAKIDELERQDELPDLKDADLSTTKDVLATFIKELDTMKQIAKLNALENTKQAMAQAVPPHT